MLVTVGETCIALCLCSDISFISFDSHLIYFLLRHLHGLIQSYDTYFTIGRL